MTDIDDIADFERTVYRRQSQPAADALVRLLDTLVSTTNPIEPQTWTRTAAALGTLVATPSFRFTPELRLALLERRRTIRLVFENSTYGSGRHLAALIAGLPDGSIQFTSTIQVEKYMTVCPLESLSSVVLDGLAELPIDVAAPLLLSLLTDPPTDAANVTFHRVLELSARLQHATLDTAMMSLATAAWAAAPIPVAPLFHRFMIASGIEPSSRALSTDGPIHLVVAIDDEPKRSAIEARIQTAALTQWYRLTFVTESAGDVVSSARAVAALEPDIVWIPAPNTAAWTVALTTVQSAPLQIATQGAPSPTDLDDALQWLTESARALEAA